MSELTQCNFCSMLEIRRRAKVAGGNVILKPSPFLGGIDVFVVPRGAWLDDSQDKAGNHGPQWKAWFMEISETCVC